VIFEAAPIDLELGDIEALQTGRQVFISQNAETTLFMYHLALSDGSSTGRWVINDRLSLNMALAFEDSWAVSPAYIRSTKDKELVNWRTSIDGNFVHDPTFQVECIGDDRNVYFDNPSYQELSGFYVERAVSQSDSSHFNGPVYSKIDNALGRSGLFMFHLESQWIIGHAPGRRDGVAFVNSDAQTVFQLERDVMWSFAAGDGSWVEERAVLTSVVDHPAKLLYDRLKSSRAIQHVPRDQSFFTLRNGVPLPMIGLGTGGLINSETYETIKSALQLGYRLFDLAREYENEEIFGMAIRDIRDQKYVALKSISEKEDTGEVEKDEKDTEALISMAQYPEREDVFIVTKVWPTQLGFQPTSEAVQASAEALKSTYIDMYLLHWPFCDTTISWMHCETIVDASGTWQQSWLALERVYAEGKIQSIGVSNFNIDQLEELLTFASVKPHLVQNYGSIGDFEGHALDEDVRDWCFRHHVVYQPYASFRNLPRRDEISDSRNSALDTISMSRSAIRHAVSLRFFLQTGASMIPRASKAEHLKENLLVFQQKYALTIDEMTELGWPSRLVTFITNNHLSLQPIHLDQEDQLEEVGFGQLSDENL
jgi:aldehyde reductase